MPRLTSAGSCNPLNRRNRNGNRYPYRPETEAGIPLDAVVTHRELIRAFEAFEDANDERLNKRDNDVILEEKLARIDSAINTQARADSTRLR